PFPFGRSLAASPGMDFRSGGVGECGLYPSRLINLEGPLMSMRMLSVAAAVSAVSFAPAPVQQVRQDRADLSRMQGDWKWEANFIMGFVRASTRVVLDGTTLEMWQCGEKLG